MRLAIDNWRWADVPFVIRAGKHLCTTVTEARIEFRHPPSRLFNEVGTQPAPNTLRLRMKPDELITLTLQAKEPGPGMVARPVDLEVDYEAALGGEGADAYERLLGDALLGDPRLFARQEAVEEAWRIVEPALDADGPLDLYPVGSWGPARAADLLDPGFDWSDCE